jgi:hypothetical protein
MLTNCRFFWRVWAFAHSLLLIAACGGTDMSVPPPARPVTEEQIVSFSEQLTRWHDSTFEAPMNLEDMLDLIPLVVTGELVDVRSGRKEYLGPDGASDGVLYASYVNLVVQPARVLKGEVEDSDLSIYVEQPWPNNLDIDELRKDAPVGVRVILLAEAVSGAQDSARKLEKEGIDQPSIPDNLVGVPAYGLIIDGVDGSALLPLLRNKHFRELVPDSRDAVDTFDDALAAVMAVEY